MSNSEIAALFVELADIIEIAGENHFKIRAYRNAAEAISTHPREIGTLTPEEIAEIPAIGEAILGKIEAIKANGAFPALEKWRAGGFASFRPLLADPAISVRKLKGLIKKYGLASLDDLRQLIADGRLEPDDKANFGKVINNKGE
jgi:DNA polymerase (family 10)